MRDGRKGGNPTPHPGRPPATPPVPGDWKNFWSSPFDGDINAPATPSNPGTPSGPNWSSADQSAFDLLSAQLASWGLSSLTGQLRQLILNGITGSDELALALQNTNEWRTRFAGNEMLKNAGLGVLSPAEYLATERSYAQIMKNYGLPAGFYDDPTDFAKFIGNNVSAAELQQRVSGYSDLMNRSEDPAIKQQLQSMGMGEGDLLAMWMDPTRAAPLIQQKYQTTLLGAAARRSGVTADNGYLGQLAARGVTEQQAGQGYGLIAGSLADAKNLSNIYHQDYGQADMEAEIFDNSGTAQKKRKGLASQERAAFSGSAGVGSLTQNTAGSY